MQSNMIIIVLILAIVCATLLNADIDPTQKGILVGAVAAGALLYTTMTPTEHLQEAVPVLNDTETPEVDIDTDSTRYSEYDNISLPRDIDSVEQRRIDLDLRGLNQSTTIDNSDAVEDAVSRFSSTFQPSNSQGVTSTSSAELAGTTLGEPERQRLLLAYSVPFNDGAYDLDESLARGQQHRGTINKRAIDGAVRSTKNVFQRTLQNELDENEEREWWSAESTKFETDFHPYY